MLQITEPYSDLIRLLTLFFDFALFVSYDIYCDSIAGNEKRLSVDTAFCIQSARKFRFFEFSFKI